MAQMASAIAEGSLSKVETEAAQTITESRNKVQDKKNTVTELKNRLSNLKEELKKYPKEISKTLSKYTKEKRTELLNKIDKTKSELKTAQNDVKIAEGDLAKLIQQYVEKDILGKDGKLKDISPTLKKFLSKLTKEEISSYQEFIGPGIPKLLEPIAISGLRLCSKSDYQCQLDIPKSNSHVLGRS